MLKRPTSRRKSHQAGIEINLVPILDTMVTLIGFLLFTTSFITLVSIESPLPQSSPDEIKEKIKEKPLQLTLTLRDQDVAIWSPFSKIPPKSVPNAQDGKPDTKAIHEALLEVKKQFPTENTVVIVPRHSVLYDTLMALMDTARTIEPTDTPIYFKNAETGNDEPLKLLFPKIVFGNLLEDT